MFLVQLTDLLQTLTSGLVVVGQAWEQCQLYPFLRHTPGLPVFVSTLHRGNDGAHPETN